MIEDVFRKYYDISKAENMYISARYYKKYSNIEFCVQFVVRHTSRVVECSGTKYQTPTIIGTLSSENTGIYSYPQIIRDWTGRNLVWKFEKCGYFEPQE
jgi:hypothetical protein